MKILMQLSLLFALLASLGCDNTTDSPPHSAQGSNDNPEVLASDHSASLFADVPLRVIAMSEVQQGNINVIELKLSTPLADQRLREQIILSPNAGEAVLSADGMRVQFRDVAPNTNYQYRILASLTAENGTTLAATQKGEFQSQPMPSSVRFDAQGAIVNLRSVDSLILHSTNLEFADLNVYRIKDDHLGSFFSDLDRFLDGASRYLRNADKQAAIEHLNSQRIELPQGNNTRHEVGVGLNTLADFDRSGIYLLTARGPGDLDFQSAMWLSVSHIGLQLRNFDERVEIFAQEIDGGKAIEGVEITRLNYNNESQSTAVTDQHGYAGFAHSEGRGSFFIARHQNAVSVIQLYRNSYDLSDKLQGLEYHQPQVQYAYFPRDLYRPGETVHFSLLAKDHDGHTLTSKQLLEVFDARGAEFATVAKRPNEFGYIQLAIELPEDAVAGYWGIRVDGGANTAYINFQVEEFLPETLEITWNNGQDAPAWALTETIDSPLQIPVLGQFLYGAPASGNRLTTSAVIRPSVRPLKNWPDYYFGNNDVGSLYLDLPEQNLDAAGVTSTELSLATLENAKVDVASLTSPALMSLSYSLFESSGRSIDRQYDVILWPKPFFVGIDPQFDAGRVPENSIAEFVLGRFDVRGEQVSEGLAKIQLIREERTGFWRHSAQRGWQYVRQDNEYLMFDGQYDFDNTATLQLPVEWGTYRLEVTDESGGLTRIRFQAGSDWYNRWMNQASLQDPEAITINLNGDGFEAGTEFIAQISSPIRGAGLWVLEADQILAKGHFDITDSTSEIRVTIPSGVDRHDLYLSAFVVSPEGDYERVRKRAFGLQHVPLDRHNQQLGLRIDTPENWLPDQNNSLSLQVINASGEAYSGPAQVTVSAVDVGALSLTDYRIEDPFAALYGPKRYAATSVSDIYGWVLEPSTLVNAPIHWGGDLMMSAARVDMQDDESLRGAERAKSSPTIATWFSGPVNVTNGSATIDVEVPDFNGALLLTAHGFGERAVGYVQQRVTVSSPVVIDFAQPRFLAHGDQLEGIIDLRNLRHEGGDLQLNIHAEGALTMTEINQTISLDRGATSQLRLPISTAKAGTEGTIVVALTGEDLNIERRWPISLRGIQNPRANFAHALVEAGGSVALPRSLLTDLQTEDLRSWLQISAQPDFGQLENWTYLVDYEYACLEQTTSRLRPWLSASSTQLNALAASESERSDMFEASLLRYRELQHPSGGFQLWPSSSNESPWLTVYAADALLTLRSAGTNVPESLIKPVIERLRSYALNRAQLDDLGYSQNPNALDASVKSYAAYVLAREGLLALGPIRDLRDRQGLSLRTPISVVHLALALRLSGDSAAADALLQQTLPHTVRPESYMGDYGSKLRDQAAVYQLLQRHDLLASVDATARFNDLFQTFRDQQWLNTQERAQLLSLSLENSGSTAWEAEVSGTDFSGLQRGDRGQRWRLSNTPLETVVSNPSSEPIFVSFAASGVATPEALAKDPVRVQLDYYLIENGQYRRLTEADEVASGSLVYAQVKAWSGQRVHDAMLISLLPAGFELVNPRLPNSPTLDELNVAGLSAGNNLYPEHEAYRDDRFVSTFDLRSDREIQTGYLLRATTPGSFQVPITLLESMYQPEVRGQTRPLNRLIIQ
ncbi:alpha-2-macroglobulin family protein [Umboniibacter marinipuniceus]|nr:MG2 domain-containing protein [Umboniibacter marinipuniceus]